ncbi:MAG TPA: hypothetical protein VH250_01305 [Granulicella sp.]|nr:hypothetical protein [Granulicella sp.]
MNRTVVLALALAVVSLPVAQPLLAAPSSQSGHVRKITMTLRNDSAASMQFKVGDDIVNLDAGKALALKLAIGTRICANDDSATHHVGDLLFQASKNYDGVTLHVK